MRNQGRPVTKPPLRLFIAGTSATAQRARQQLSALQTRISPEWQVEIVDVVQAPEIAERAGILATPTLTYEHPERPRRIVGDLSDTKRVLEFLGIELKGTEP
jgi:circadian clock protein KaiB